MKPTGSSGLRARANDEAIVVAFSPLEIQVVGQLSTSVDHNCVVCIPRVFPYVLMKLAVFRNRLSDGSKNEGRHHPLDLYRTIAMITEADESIAKQLILTDSARVVLAEATRIIDTYFAPRDGLGRIRFREHPLAPANVDLDAFVSELRRVVGLGEKSTR